ncbi:MAG: CIA30 family protein [Bacteroidota bacterium]
MILKEMSLIALAIFFSSGFLIETEFNFGKDKMGNDWEVINDGVMGGLSKGKIEMTENTLKFSGSISLDNYGGFTSVKSPFTKIDLSNSKKVKIRYRTKNQSVAISLENSKEFYKPYFKMNLANTNNEWKTVDRSINEFKENKLGQETSTQISSKFLESVQRIGLITSQKKEGDFTVEIDYIKFE